MKKITGLMGNGNRHPRYSVDLQCDTENWRDPADETSLIQQPQRIDQTADVPRTPALARRPGRD